jgi:hypothetical protein
VTLTKPVEAEDRIDQSANCHLLSAPNNNINIKKATLDVELLPTTGDHAPVAVDMYPKEVLESRTGTFDVFIGTDLKFTLDDLPLDKQLGKIKYTHDKSLVRAYEVETSHLGWEFVPDKDNPLQGSKSLYLIIYKPHSAEAVALHLRARATIGKGIFGGMRERIGTGTSKLIVCTD